MIIGENAVVGLRYQLKNSRGEILESNLGGKPVYYLHAAEGLPAFTHKLTGLQQGSVAALRLLRSEFADAPDDFDVDVIIDEVRPATHEELTAGKLLSDDGENNLGCGPDCIC